MTNGPPSSAAGSSKTPGISPHTYTHPVNGSGSDAYSAPFTSWPPSQAENAQVSASHQNANSQTRSYYRSTTYEGQGLPQARKYQAPYATKQPPTPASIPATPNVPTPRILTPPPASETYKHWDKAIRHFLICANLTQTLQGLENDMLVLNSEWEQNAIPKALKELQQNLQNILNGVEGKKKAEEVDVNIESTSTAEDADSLDERKLEYATLATDKLLRSQSSINKSISQFLAKTRARNDASNRAEFLYSLAEKKRRLQEELGPEAAAGAEVSSCARVDAKLIDRDKQMKYDIAKNGEGPLTRTVKINTAPAVPTSSFSITNYSAAPVQPSTPASSSSISVDGVPQPTKKRKYEALEDPEYNLKHASSKGKGRAYDNEDSETAGVDGEQLAVAAATAEKHPGLDERLKNIEVHLALRYVPTPPRTLLARLKYLEDHIIKLENEYPPWAALHFNQPDRGWPAPPRATPIIVPPQLRSAPPASAQVQRLGAPVVPNVNPMGTATTLPTEVSSVASGSNTAVPQAPPPISIPKSRRATSSLQQAILDRLEVQRAMSELNSARGT